MEFINNYIWLIPIFPFIGFLINGSLSFFSRGPAGAKTKKAVSFLSPLMVFLSFLMSIAVFINLLNLPADKRVIINTVYSWIKTGMIDANISFLIDPLSIIMALVITGVGFLIHVYSTGYMHEEESFPRYFAYLNLFTFAMLLLVLGDNLLLMFVGWEGVGLCSYLLIGFWHKDINNASAGMKAFIVNRIGDFGFLIGFFILFWALYSYSGKTFISFREMQSLVSALPGWIITTVAILLFVGATGKSAQIPLYVWLPDAMAGPTPVSALIHAATMVTAGIYMIGRMNFLFVLSPMALTVISIVAVLTAFFAATIGIAQNDIKKVLAYSTVSQLGFMFLGIGAGAFGAGVFHLMTHAFFKGLLFLGSGSVIMAMHHEQDMRKMGGLREKIPVTFWTFFIGTLAIAGIPGLSGFFSKDEILWKAFSTHNDIIPWLPYALWGMGALTAGITSFYMFRLLFMTFFGKFRGDHHTWEHMKESPLSMTLPLSILALLSVIGGYLGVPGILGGSDILGHWLAPVTGGSHGQEHASHLLEALLMAASVFLSLCGIGLAYLLYIAKPEIPGKISSALNGFYKTLYNKYYIDEIYEKVFVNGLLNLNKALKWFDINVIDAFVNWIAKAVLFVSRGNGIFDARVIDGMVNGIGSVTRSAGSALRNIQGGRLTDYLYYVVGGVAVLFLIKIFLGGM